MLFCHVRGKKCEKFSLKYSKSNSIYQHNVNVVATLCKTGGLNSSESIVSIYKQRKCFWFLSYCGCFYNVDEYFYYCVHSTRDKSDRGDSEWI